MSQISEALSAAVGALEAAGFYSALCSVHRNVYGQDAIGARVVTGSTPIATDVPCQIGVPTASWDYRAGTETFKPAMTEVRRQRQINLNSYYPAIEPACVATVAGVVYNILSVVHDSTRTFTELTVEVVTV